MFAPSGCSVSGTMSSPMRSRSMVTSFRGRGLAGFSTLGGFSSIIILMGVGDWRLEVTALGWVRFSGVR